MFDVVGITFEKGNRVYYFSNNKLNIKKGDKLVVETERGLQFCTAATDIIQIPEAKIVSPLRPILRLATKEDKRKNDDNNKTSREALEKAKKISNELKLDMKFIDCIFTLDRNQLVFNFIADDRVDFRDLAKRLASIYKTRIELRQVGVRDKAKEIGGIGPCGRILCCNTFLNDFNSVSINMAKNQNISLNPTKINGICGRLLCCLKYEDDTYTELKKNFPSIGTKIKIDGVEVKVVSHNVLNKKITIEKPDKTQMEVEYNNESNK
ncbi:MAG: stage 0 sporulation family protein [Bacilli bacterium]|nr:stage 0 sporulation family protein [Bacilli bacterium]